MQALLLALLLGSPNPIIVPGPGYVSPAGEVSGNLHFDDDEAATFGNTAAAPDCRWEWDTAGTDQIMLWCTDCDGIGTDCAPFTIDTGTDDIDITGSIVTSSGTTIADGGTDGHLIIQTSGGQGVKFDTATTDGWVYLDDEGGGALVLDVSRVNNSSFFTADSSSWANSLITFKDTSTIRSDPLSSTTATKDISISSGAQSNAGDYDTGSVTVSTGATTTDGDSGDINLTTGAAGAGAADAGDIIMSTHGNVVGLRILGADGLVYLGTAAQGIKLDTSTTADRLTLTDESGNAASLYSNAFYWANGANNSMSGGDIQIGTGDGSLRTITRGGAATNDLSIYTGAATSVTDLDSGSVTIYSGATTTDGDTGDVILRTGAAGAGAGDAGDIYFQVHGTNNAVKIEGNGGSVNMYDSGGTNCAYWREFHVDATKTDPGGSGATLTVVNTATLTYLLDANTEYLYMATDIHDDWDAASDVVVEVQVALSGAETANDIINAEVVAEYHGEHEDLDTGYKTQTRTINHDIVNDNAQGDIHHLVFVLDYDLASNVIQADDNIQLRFRLDSVGGGTDVAAVWFYGANVKYRTCKPQLETGASFPSEG